MTGVYLGTPLCAPAGFDVLEAGATYYFLISSARRQLVRLVRFVERPSTAVKYPKAKRATRNVTPSPFPILTTIGRLRFERTLGKQIVPVADGEETRSLPPWLSDLEGRNLTETDRKHAKRPHSERIAVKVAAIKPLTDNYRKILEEEDPDLAINRHARSLGPRYNELRVRLWFYTFLAFGMNPQALHYPTHRIGHWDRYANSNGPKRGRPHHKGKGYGHNVSAKEHNDIVTSYIANCGLGVGENEIYVAAMKGPPFGCKVRKDAQGNPEIYHPKGRPFPLKPTYFHHVGLEFEGRTTQKIFHGKTVARSRFEPTRGSFTENTWNLMQRTERDAYAIEQLPKGYVEGSSLRPLYVEKKRDVTSGEVTGIGFTQGSERSNGYRFANFCEAISKVKFCALFGLRIKPHQWVSEGVAPHDIQDRGPGSSPKARSRTEEYEPVIDELSVKGSGQSKAVIESSNPKSRNNKETPSFIQSDCRSVELARREIMEVIQFNNTCNIRNRIDPAIKHLVKQNSPNGLWIALASLGRNDAVLMPFEDAVRAYLDLVPARLTRNGVILNSRTYKSEALSASGALNSVLDDEGIDIQVYVLEACIRHIWLDWNGYLIELNVHYKIVVDEIVTYMSLEEAVQFSKHLRTDDLDHAERRLAHMLDTQLQYEEQTGMRWKSAKRVAGRPKRGTRIAKQEASEARHATAGNRHREKSSRRQ
jgi:hypothetical protein